MTTLSAFAQKGGRARIAIWKFVLMIATITASAKMQLVIVFKDFQERTVHIPRVPT
jgi:hypothetical protein